MLTPISDRLKKKVEDAMSGDATCTYEPSVIFYNPNSGFKFTSRYLKFMQVIQDFFGNYTDNIQIVIDVTVDEKKEMLLHMKDLECTIILRPFDTITSTLEYDQEPIIFSTKVLMQDQEDVNKKFNSHMFKDEDEEFQTPAQSQMTTTYTLNLVEPKVYATRHVQLNSIFNDTTIEKVLHWSANQFGITTVKIVKPDNNYEYLNFIIPPMHDISSIYTFMQEVYGIYAKGMSYYVTDDTLYIYPPYDYTLETSTEEGAIHLINAPTYFLGNDRYHKVVDNDLHIVSNTAVTLKNMNTEGTENIGNVHISTNADGMRDNFIKVQADGKVMRNTNDISIVSLHNQAGNMSSDTQNVKFKGERTNIFSSTSLMAMMNCTMLSCGWNKAVPRLLKPSHNVTYHYDGNGGEYDTQLGRLFRVVYVGNLQPTPSDVSIISFSANIEVALIADFQSSDELQYA